MKPHFIPLKAIWFDRFARGEKTVEYRRNAGAFTIRTCWPDRPVILSRGYSGEGTVARCRLSSSPVL
jgi:hypothetical protein